MPKVVLFKSNNPLGADGFVDDDNRFLLTKEEWYAVQRYVRNAISLPITEMELRLGLGIEDEDEDISNFLKLIDGYEDDDGNRIHGYKDVHGHGMLWKEKTYPFIVELGHDLRHYADGVPPNYGDLIDKVTLLEQADIVRQCLENDIPPFVTDPAYEYLTNYNLEQIQGIIKLTKIQLSELLNQRIGEAKKYAEKASDAEQQVKEFNELITKDRDDMQILLDSFIKDQGSQSEELKEIRDELEEKREEVDALNAEYEKSVILASTSPLYLLIWPFGYIVSPTIAGIYGDAARKLKAEIDLVNERIADLVKQEERAMRMEGYLEAATESLESIQGDVGEAVQVLGKMAGSWELISRDLQNIVEELEVAEGGEVPPSLQKNNIKTAMAQWETVNEAATGFVTNAYVEEVSRSVYNLAA